MILLIFIITVIAEILLIGSLIMGLAKPRYRIWPPLKKNSWKFRISWILMVMAVVGFIVLAFLDWNTFFITHWLRYPIGAMLILFGTFIALWAVKTISIHSTLGLGGKLVTSGPYQYTRNPQHVGDIIIMVGIFIFSNSSLTIITGLVGSLWFVLATFSEEQWCQEHFKESYMKYCKNVRRFI